MHLRPIILLLLCLMFNAKAVIFNLGNVSINSSSATTDINSREAISGFIPDGGTTIVQLTMFYPSSVNNIFCVPNSLPFQFQDLAFGSTVVVADTPKTIALSANPRMILDRIYHASAQCPAPTRSAPTGPFNFNLGQLRYSDINGNFISNENIEISGTLSLSSCDWPSTLDLDFGDITSGAVNATLGTATNAFTIACTNIPGVEPEIIIDSANKDGNMILSPTNTGYGISLKANGNDVVLGTDTGLAGTGTQNIILDASIIQRSASLPASNIDAVAEVTLKYN